MGIGQGYITDSRRKVDKEMHWFICQAFTILMMALEKYSTLFKLQNKLEWNCHKQIHYNDLKR